MPPPSATPDARAEALMADARLEVTVSGAWKLAGARPSWASVRGERAPAVVALRWGRVEAWDSSLLLFLFEAMQWCTGAGAACDTAGLPEGVRAQLGQFTAARATPAQERGQNVLVAVGLATRQLVSNARDLSAFVGEAALGAGRALRRPGKFRFGDCLEQMQQCGALALPIVSLISFLTGLTLAYQAAIFAQRYGGDIYVADAVAISTVREMGPLMAAVIMAGRTGAAFAATLGNMQAGEEIDALRVLGISPVDFLVLPRLLALGLMLPLLALYADVVSILGGMFVARALLHIPPSAYWIETQGGIGIRDLDAGLIKAATFGLLIGLAGCLRGLRAERSAAGVGRAATSAVVTGILLIVVGDALFAVIFNVLKI